MNKYTHSRRDLVINTTPATLMTMQLTGAVGLQNSTLNAGDTMESIAFQVYGDSSLWYLIADANGITEKAGLTAPAVAAQAARSSAAPASVVRIMARTLPRPLQKKRAAGLLRGPKL